MLVVVIRYYCESDIFKQTCYIILNNKKKKASSLMIFFFFFFLYYHLYPEKPETKM